jgi:hypothetical protein
MDVCSNQLQEMLREEEGEELNHAKYEGKVCVCRLFARACDSEERGGIP